MIHYKRPYLYAALLAVTISLTACTASDAQQTQTPTAPAPMAAPDAMPSGAYDEAIFAGGCFWCVESDFEKIDGVVEAISGYSGGDMISPTYRNHGQHLEVAKIVFDPAKVTYKELLDYYWVHVDPTDPHGQFCDKGHAYQTAIYARPDQIDAARTSKAAIESIKPFKAAIVTPVLPAKTFWDAEDYHQDYYKKNPVRYNYYRTACRRDATVKALWGDMAIDH